MEILWQHRTAIWLCGMGMVSPFVLILILVSVSIPVPVLVQDGSSERGGTVQGLALRAVGFYRGGGAILVVYGGSILHLGLVGAGWLWGQI